MNTFHKILGLCTKLKKIHSRDSNVIHASTPADLTTLAVNSHDQYNRFLASCYTQRHHSTLELRFVLNYSQTLVHITAMLTFIHC